MVKVRAKKFINFGKVDKHLLYFKEGEVKDLPNNEIYNKLIGKAVDEGFLEIIETDFPRAEENKKENKKEKKDVEQLEEVKETITKKDKEEKKS